jgi:hypothetical protein
MNHTGFQSVISLSKNKTNGKKSHKPTTTEDSSDSRMCISYKNLPKMLLYFPGKRIRFTIL